MDLSQHFEDLHFTEKRKINVSKQITPTFVNLLHWHPFVEVVYCKKNNQIVTVNFHDYSLNTNDLLFIFPGDLHSFQSTDLSAFTIIQFPFDLIHVMGELDQVGGRGAVHVPYDETNHLMLAMMGAVKALEGIFESKPAFTEVRMYQLLLDLFMNFAQYLEIQKSAEDRMDKQSAQIMAQACLFIANYSNQPLTLNQVASYVGYSRFHFAHLFRQYTQHTFTAYLAKERIKHAEAKLSQLNKSISEIAFEVGFSSLSSFNRCFKQQKGLSPSEFRSKLIFGTNQ